MSKILYNIPMMKIHDVLLELDDNPKVFEMVTWCERNCKEAWHHSDELERRWYKEFKFASRWDAVAFMHKFKKYM